MRFKKTVLLVVELLCILLSGVITSVFFTGGWSVSINSLTLQVYDVVNPVLFLVILLGLRRWLTGSFLHGWQLQRYAEKIVQPVFISKKTRIYVAISLLVLLLLTVVLWNVDSLQEGLTGRYYGNTNWEGHPLHVFYDRNFSLHKLREQFLVPSENYSIVWTGVMFIPSSGKYFFTTTSDDGSDLFIHEQHVVDNSGLHGVVKQAGSLFLEKGVHPVSLRYMQGSGGAHFSVSWKPPGKRRQSLSTALLFPEAPENIWLVHAYRLKKASLPILVLVWSGLAIIAVLGTFSWCVSNNPAAWTVRPFYGKILVFFLISTVGMNILLSLAGNRFPVDDSTFWRNSSSFRNKTALYYTHFFLSSPVHTFGDSWRHMYNALEYFDDPQQQSRYSELFFEKQIKFIYPPTSLLLFKPFSTFSVEQVVSRANLISWCLIVLSAFLVARILSISIQRYLYADMTRGERWIVYLLSSGFTILFYPIMRSFRLGQAQTWLYVLFVAAIWLWLEDRKGFSGVAIGVICLVKPQLGLLAFWGLFRKQWRFATAIFLTAGVVGIVSIYVFGWQNHLDYLHVLSYISQRGESFHPNQSINGFLNRLLFNGTNLTWDAHLYPPYHRVIHLATTMSSAVLILFALFWKRPLSQDEDGGTRHALPLLDLLIASLSFTMASPLAWEHHYSFLLPMFAYVLPLTLASRFKKVGVWIVGLSFVLVTNYYQFTGLFAETYLNFLQSYVLFGALLFLVYLYRFKNLQFSS